MFLQTLAIAGKMIEVTSFLVMIPSDPHAPKTEGVTSAAKTSKHQRCQDRSRGSRVVGGIDRAIDPGSYHIRFTSFHGQRNDQALKGNRGYETDDQSINYGGNEGR